MEKILSGSITARLITDKPIRKTPYQVKGVFMKQFPDEKIVPFLDGRLRSKYLYPRVQVKIINEQIYILGINEGVEPVISILKNLKSFSFGDLSIKVDSAEVEENKDSVLLTDKLLRYKFITPWIALNAGGDSKYKRLGDDEKPLFLNKLLGQNLLFLSKELGLNISSKIFTKIEVESFEPEKVDENGWKSFKGEFKTNFILPSFIGFGNGITRGFGSIFSLNNINNLEFKDSKEVNEDYVKEEIDDSDAEISYVTVDDAPTISRRKKKKKFMSKKPLPQTKSNSRKNKFKEKSNNSIKKEVNNDDESRFNSEEYHKKQHDF
jgi:hypothetical protein|tara:strand:- start:1988 stop:2953 length:966 start_codon:yes stop_codon:yes gene_type:complete